MDFSSHTVQEDFSPRFSAQRPIFHSLSRPSTTSNMPSPRKITPPEDEHRRVMGHKKLSPIYASTMVICPPTPPESFAALGPTDISRYEAMFQESIRARKERRKWTFTPLHEVERVQISCNGFDKLYQALGGGELGFRWPSITFNSRTLTGIIKWMPSGIHENCASSFIARHAVAVELLPPNIARRMKATGSQRIGTFTGAYKGSKKEADVLFKYQQQNQKLQYTCAVEIGFAETYEELVEDARLWIEGRHDIKTVVLIKVEEDPLYRSPIHKLQDDEIEALDLPHFPDLDTSMVVLEDRADGFGPLQIRNLTWVGRMSAFLEIWKANATTGFAELQGDRQYFMGVDNEIAELDIRIHDLYPIGPADGGDERLPLTWDLLRHDIEAARYELAVERCQEMLNKLANREDNINDPEYIP